MTDVLASPDGSLGRWHDIDAPQEAWKQQIPIFFSNPDLLWVRPSCPGVFPLPADLHRQGNDYPEPRFGQGAFQEAFRAVWKRTTGRELAHVTTGGKPTELTYRYAERLLLEQANHPEILPSGSQRVQKLGCTFMLGDNPFSDIAGANAYGFSSILVRTGVFRGKENHHIHPATKVEADVFVSLGIERKKVDRY